MQRKDLQDSSREDLIARAEKLGIERARTLGRDELIDAIARTAVPEAPRSRGGWFGRARDLLTSVIDRGLGVAEGRTSEVTSRPVGRRSTDGRTSPSAPPPMPTVTLAEIYAAQGHLDRAITTLDEVIARDPEHPEAPRLRARFEEQLHRTRPSAPPSSIEANMERTDGRSPDEATLSDDSPETTAEVGSTAASAEATSERADAEPAREQAGAEPQPSVELAQELAGLELDGPSYEVDEIVALPVDPTTVYLYWEVRPQTLARARDERPSGALVVRVVEVATSGVPSPEARDVRVDALYGELFVRGLTSGAEVRVSVGWLDQDDFVPFAVGDELATPRVEPASEVAESYRTWSQAGSSIARGDEALLAAFRPSRAPATAPVANRNDEEALLSRFPAGVWLEPSGRLVHVVDRAEDMATPVVPGGSVERTRTTRRSFVERLPGSSDLIRRELDEVETERHSWPGLGAPPGFGGPVGRGAWSMSSHATRAMG